MINVVVLHNVLVRLPVGVVQHPADAAAVVGLSLLRGAVPALLGGVVARSSIAPLVSDDVVVVPREQLQLVLVEGHVANCLVDVLVAEHAALLLQTQTIEGVVVHLTVRGVALSRQLIRWQVGVVDRVVQVWQ